MSGQKRLGARISMLGFAAAIGIAIPLGGAFAATDATPPDRSGGESGLRRLEKHCSRCHQEGKLRRASGRRRISATF